MRKYAVWLLFVGFSVITMAQTKVNPVTQIRWPLLTGSGAPTAVCNAGNYGQPYQDTSVTPNVNYACGTDGWARLGGSGGGLIQIITASGATAYSTIAAAIASLPITGNVGGVITLQPGTYVGPTSIPSGVRIVAAGGLYPPNVYTQFSGSAFNSFAAPPASAALTILQYSSSLTIQDVNRIALSGVILDFQGTGNLTIKGVSFSDFDMAVVNTALTAPAVTLDGDPVNSYGSAFNRFRNLITQGGNGGVQIGNATSGAMSDGDVFTESIFDSVHVMTSAAPSGRFTVLSFVGNCDSNIFEKVSFWATTAVTNIDGVVFGSSLTADTDADLVRINHYDETLASARTGGHAIVVNYSTNNSINTGVIEPGTDGLYAYYADTGGLPYNSPWFQWNDLGNGTPNPYGPFAQFPGVVLDEGVEGTPALTFQYGGVKKAQFYGGTGATSGHLYMLGNAFNSGAGGNIDDWTLASGTLTHHALLQTQTLGVDPGEGGTHTANYAAQTVLTNTSTGGAAAMTLKFQAGSGQAGNDVWNYYNNSGSTKLANVDSAGNFFGQNVSGTGVFIDNGSNAAGYSYSRSGALKYSTQLGTDGNFYLYGGSSGTTQYLQINTAGNWTIPGSFTASGGFIGNAATATALAATPSQCASGNVSTGIAANGSANCTAPSGSVTLAGDVTGASGANTVGAVHATSGTLNGVTIGGSTVAAANVFTLGVGNATLQAANSMQLNDASGLAYFYSYGMDSGTYGGFEFECAVATGSSSHGCLLSDGAGDWTIPGTFTASGFVGNASTASSVPYSGLTGTVPTWNQSTTGNAATATALAATPSQCGANLFATGIASGGAANCANPTNHSDYWSVQPGLFSTATMLGAVYYEPVATQYGDLLVRQSGTISCAAAPTVNIMDLGTSQSTAYGSASTFISFTTGTSDGVYTPTGLGIAPVTIAGHFYGVAFSGGTCATAPTFDITMQLGA